MFLMNKMSLKNKLNLKIYGSLTFINKVMCKFS